MQDAAVLSGRAARNRPSWWKRAHKKENGSDTPEPLSGEKDKLA
jgi:hypothetical protein